VSAERRIGRWVPASRLRQLGVAMRGVRCSDSYGGVTNTITGSRGRGASREGDGETALLLCARRKSPWQAPTSLPHPWERSTHRRPVIAWRRNEKGTARLSGRPGRRPASPHEHARHTAPRRIREGDRPAEHRPEGAHSVQRPEGRVLTRPPSMRRCYPSALSSAARRADSSNEPTRMWAPEPMPNVQ